MQDIFGSVRKSLVFRITEGGEEGGRGSFAEKIGSCLRKSRVGLLTKPRSPSRPLSKDISPQIRWRKGELIGCGAYGRVYMGMNLDSGELLAVKQVLIAANHASKERTQAHIRELEEEVKLLKNLSHPNIVRYLGTAREEETLNIMLEFVPGGSISSLLGKFGSFPEAVIRMYTKQLLQGLEYLHKNGIIHRDIKGANILVDNKGCIKLADFGASKKVVDLATMSGAKSMKGTPYWMAPEVIRQTGHSFSADIWSVGCTVIEMATGKPPWSQQYQLEAPALFHVGSTKEHPPIPEHLSVEAKDFLEKCLAKEANSRPTASDLLQHPFVTTEYQDPHPISRASVMQQSCHHQDHSPKSFPVSTSCVNKSISPMGPRTTGKSWKNVHDVGSVRCSTIYPEKLSRIGSVWETSTSDDMCQLDDFEVAGSIRPDSASTFDQFNRSFNPMSEPLDDWPCKFDESPEPRGMPSEDSCGSVTGAGNISGASAKEENGFTFPCGTSCEDDEEVTESKIRAFLDEKALDLNKLQTPLYQEFYNISNAASSPGVVGNTSDEVVTSCSKLPPKSKLSPSRLVSRTSPLLVDDQNTTSPGNCSRRVSTNGGASDQILREIPLPHLNEWGGGQQEPNSPSLSFAERQRKWKEELDAELQRERAMKRQMGVGGKVSSPNDRGLNRKRDRLIFTSPGK
ncbi:mitogen-activated protein kinase kinase kinase NPK1-like isoform X3 [Tasmannia lanceolata]|uniref:mitogen-activated protein kinase kinase kinase NPK1-like isoform X3 n=1 Tax=Tasmannia lanceolata TaxID=3420 RepID=UPI0040637032